MEYEFDARHLPIDSFATAKGQLTVDVHLSTLERLSQEAVGSIEGASAHIVVQGFVREGGGAGLDQVWLRIAANLTLPMVCQRCLGPVDMLVAVDREFRFVATEAQAEAEDEGSEEDVLVLSRDFDVIELVEDEFLMALPAVPKHEVCPVQVLLQVQDPNFDAAANAKPNPFAVLGKLKT